MKNTIKLYLLSLTLFFTSCSSDERYGGNFQGDPSTDGQNGSYTAMVSLIDRLYYIDFNTLYTADITDPSNIAIIDQQEIGTRLESIFFNNGLLFVGSGPAMHIYALNSEGIPTKFSETQYTNFDGDFFPCDPVVADDNFAYATLSTFESGGFDAWFFFIPVCTRPTPINQLRIYDISDLTNPILVNTTELNNPKGLAVDGNLLFVCDRSEGLKVFNITERNNPVLLKTLTDIAPFDVIARDSKLIVTGPSSIAQYDYSNIQDIKLLSLYSL